MRRFEVLDSWRGIAACLVALYHLRAVSHVQNITLVRHAYLLVDLFFVLSGFVIAANYQTRLGGGFGVVRFMALRAGRLYPVHLAVLAVYAAWELLRFAAAPATAAAPGTLAGALAANVALVHNYSALTFLPLNYPSWSIAAEMWTYLLFALAFAVMPRALWVAVGAAMIVCPVILYVAHGHVDATEDFAVVRCIYGFGAGVICWRLYQRAPIRSNTAVEIGAVIVAAVFVVAAGRTPLSLAAPVIFGGLMLVFAQEAGSVSRLLRMPGFLFLGATSYSLYMVHAFIAARFGTAAKAIGIQQPDESIGTELWHGDVAFLLYGLAVLVVAWLVHRFIEMPSRSWSRTQVANLTKDPIRNNLIAH